MKIVVRRTGALGDVICITPVLRELRVRYPTAQIVVETGYPAALLGCDANIVLQQEPGADMRIDLDLAYEKRPRMHVVDAYFEGAFGPGPWNIDRTLTMKSEDPWPAPETVILHAARSWASRTMPNAFWDLVARELLDMGLKPIFIGTRKDYGGPFTATDARARLRLTQIVSLISGAKLFVGSDSSLLHAAGATDTPLIGLYTAVRAKYRAPHRQGVLGWNMIALEADIDCVGCLERKPAPSTYMTCERGDNLCVRSIAPQEVIRAARQLLRLDPAEQEKAPA